jgi:NDP-hexose-3-ketoreductase
MGSGATVPPLRIGVMGCASVAVRNTLPAIGRVAGTEVAAIASRTLTRAEDLAVRFGGEPVEGYERLLDHPGVDAIYVALPTGLHVEWALRALRAGKHVLVEKPLATRLAEAEQLVAAAREHGRCLMENFMFLHHSQHATVRELIERGRIGEPRVFAGAFGIPPLDPGDVRYRADLGGGALADVGVYPLRAARLFLGEEFAVLGALLRVDRDRGVDLEGSALLATPAGVSAQITFGFRSSYRSMYSIWGSEGHIELERAFTPPPYHRPALRVVSQDRVEEITLPADDQFANVLRAFARSAARGESTGTGSLLRHAELVETIHRQAARRPA